MKKRSLFKRLLSGFVATAMALSICFSDKVFEDLFASAENGDFTVNVDFKDSEEETVYDGHENGMRYFVLGALVKENASPALTVSNDANIVAWECKEIYPQTNSHSTVTFSEFRLNDHDFDNPDRQEDDPKVTKTSPECANTVFVERVYRYWGSNPYCPRNPDGSFNIEPTNLVNPRSGSYYAEYSADSFTGFVPSSSTDGDTTNVIFKKRHVEFYVNVNFSKETTITEDEYYYVLVETVHTTGDKTYFYSRLTANNDDVVMPVQNKDNRNWIKEGQSTPDQHEQYNGGEKSTTVKLFKANSERNLGNLISGSECTELKTGDFAKGQKIVIRGQSSKPEKPSNNDTLVTYYETINFEKMDESDNYTFKEILGSGISFGITADRFRQKGHFQSNFAANYFSASGNFDPDLSKPSAGEIYVANFANLDTPTDTSAANKMQMDIGASHQQKEVMGPDADTGAVLYIPNDDTYIPDVVGNTQTNRLKISRDHVTVDNKTYSSKRMSDEVVNPIIQQMQGMSARLASKPTNYTPIKIGTKWEVDTTDYPDDATIYIDADVMTDANGDIGGNAEMTIKKKDGQLIVFNSTKANVGVRELNLVVDGVEGGTKESQKIAGVEGGEQNDWLNKHVMRSVVWNLSGATEAAITNTAGIFLIPKSNSVTKLGGTSTGWLVTAGYFENTSGEWHFPYDELEKYKKPEQISVNVSKKAITGDDELENAQLELTSKNLPESEWRYLAEKNSFAQKITDEATGMITGLKWTSGTSQKTLTLRDGDFTLKETGTTFKSGGKEYKVVTSSFDFEITNGKITKVSKDVSEDNGTIKYTDTNNTITIRDAQAGGPVTYPVYVSKTEITGQKAVAGATITVYTDTPNVADRVKVDDYETRAVDGSRGTFMLEAGNYVLVEKATVDDRAPSLNGKTYKVITTEFKFEVKADGTVECTGAKASVDNFTDDEKANGGLVLTKLADKNEPYFIMCDAANTTSITVDKQAVTGEHTIKNAHLWLTDSTGSAVPGADITTVGDAEKDKFTVVLEDGEYTIHEEAAKDKSGKPLDITDENGDKYNIIPSAVKFTVVNGAVTSTDAKASKSDLDENGGVFVEGTTLHVCDAIKPRAVVTINKKDVTGKEELEGATLTLTKADGSAIPGLTNNSWESKKGATWNVQLQEGDYILKESGTKVTDENGWEYDVLNTDVAFSIDKEQD